MPIKIETERLFLREFQLDDTEGLFELDSNPLVHQYLGTKPLSNIEQAKEVICFIQKQYSENGIGRWALIRKSDEQFLGWAGLKFIKEATNGYINFYDLGYRLIPKYWGIGYATEAAKAALKFGFDELEPEYIYGITEVNNTASQNVLQKCGLGKINNFEMSGELLSWHQIKKPERF